MKPIILYVANSETNSEFINISKDKFQQIVDKAYEAGLDDAKSKKQEIDLNAPHIKKTLLEGVRDG